MKKTTSRLASALLYPLLLSSILLASAQLWTPPASAGLNLKELSLEELTIAQVQQQIRSGQLSSEKLVQFYLKRIEQYDDNGIRLNAVVQLNENALARARALDLERKNKGSRGPLHGIPVLLKDNIDTADGMANTAGSIALKNNKPTQDAFLVQQLRHAGAIIMGKTNLSE
jgi:Asp-tRNA(Asn)/Glu-tRNA(Gln) amidotransferase A subunit family amidase